MAFALIDSVSVGSTGGGTVTSAAIDTTGADLLVLALSWYDAEAAPTISDSETNTWTALTARDGNHSGAAVQFYYVEAPAVDGSHTFSANGAGHFGSIAVLALSGAAASSAFDVQNGATTASAATLQPGSVTPGEDNELVVCALGSSQALTETIGDSFTKEEDVEYAGSNHMGVALSYKIQTSAGAENPTWTFGATAQGAAAIATFKSDGGGGGSIIPQASYYYQYLNG
jgi:hypothetical protein